MSLIICDKSRKLKKVLELFVLEIISTEPGLIFIKLGLFNKLLIVLMALINMEAFPAEERCSSLLFALNLYGDVKEEVYKKVRQKEKVCLESIIQASKARVVCPLCSHFKAYRLTGKYPFKCSKKEHTFGIRSNTIFQNGKLSLRLYFAAIFLNKSYEGLTYDFLAKVTGTTKKTAGEMLKKIRFVKEYRKFKDEDRKAEAKKVGIKIEATEKVLNHNKFLIETLEDYLTTKPELISIIKILNLKSMSFVSYPGSKRSLMKELLKKVPVQINNYYEIFAGGATMFFALSALKKAGVININNMSISDYNQNVVDMHKGLSKNPEEVCALLEGYKSKYNLLTEKEDRRAFFKEVRKTYNSIGEGPEKSASFIFLSSTCFNGRLDFSKKGKFTGGHGKKGAFNFDRETMLRCGEALSKPFVNISCNSYEHIESIAGEGDLVFCDPPYISIRESMTSYGSSLVTEIEQTKLRDFILRLHHKGVRFMISNYEDPVIMELYSDTNIFKIHKVKVVRVSDEGAFKDDEVIITNY